LPSRGSLMRRSRGHWIRPNTPDNVLARPYTVPNVWNPKVLALKSDTAVYISGLKIVNMAILTICALAADVMPSAPNSMPRTARTRTASRIDRLSSRKPTKGIPRMPPRGKR